jgi:hypothetical protein
MGWKEGREDFSFLSSAEALQLPIRPFKVNERCFIRKEHKCGKIFGASKSCFIACPDEEELQPMLDLFSEKLAKVGIETIIAVKERAYGQDIFCTKICGKIIESKFCVTILDDSIYDGKNIPNPNVYYEYGLMTSLGKHIIPLQKEDLKLAFNIQSYDTIKYTSGNMGTELDRAIKDAIRITESRDKEDKKAEGLPEKVILRHLELSGLELKDEEWFLDDVINDTEFKGFGQYAEAFYVYLGKLDDQEEMQTYLDDLNIVIYRTEKKFEDLERDIQELEKKIKQFESNPKYELGTGHIHFSYSGDIPNLKKKIKDKKRKADLMSHIYIGFIINSGIDISDFIKNAESMVSKYHRFSLTYNKNSEILFGDIKVNLDYSKPSL